MRRTKKVRLFLCLGSLSGVVWAGTFATFTDSGTAESTFTAGSVDLTIDGDADDAYGFTAIEMSNMKPGDVKYAPLTIANAGSLGFSYSMGTTTTNNTLGDQLQMGIVKVANTAACDSAGAGYATAALTASNILAAEGALRTRTIASRTLASGNEVLCFKVQLPSSTGDSFQGATTTATFTFSATQA